jgi:hypothetical protein
MGGMLSGPGQRVNETPQRFESVSVGAGRSRMTGSRPLLANVTTQFNEELEYDALEGKIVNNAEADALLRRAYRDGWSL